MRAGEAIARLVMFQINKISLIAGITHMLDYTKKKSDVYLDKIISSRC